MQTQTWIAHFASKEARDAAFQAALANQDDPWIIKVGELSGVLSGRQLEPQPVILYKQTNGLEAAFFMGQGSTMCTPA